MIKAEVNVTGTVKRNAGIRTDRNNNPYLSLILTVCLPDAKQTNHSIDVFVSLPNARQEDVYTYTEGSRLTVNGSMDFRKKEEELQFYLTGNLVSIENVTDLDAIGGTMTFRGHLKKENVYEQKTDKNGHPYIVFSAYSSEKVGEVKRGTYLKVTGSEGNWYKVTTRNGVTGYISKSYVSLGATGRTVANLNVRQGAGSSTTKLATLAKGTSVTILSVDGNWAKIRYGKSSTGYVSIRYLNY